MFSLVLWLLFCSYVIEIAVPFLAFAPVRILRVFVYCSEVRDQPVHFKCDSVSLISISFFFYCLEGVICPFSFEPFMVKVLKKGIQLFYSEYE